MQCLYYCSRNKYDSFYHAANEYFSMSPSLLLFLIFVVLIAFIAKIATSNFKNDTYTDINTDEWNCPSCGFLVQVGDHCIYCNTKRIEE